MHRRLLNWFRRHRREFPWRRTRDPYSIWVSEIMLQQTQAAVVVPYFERFLAAFPTLTDLAKASTEDVLRLWEGLGYYRRAHHLHEAAQHIVRCHAGRFPQDPQIVRQLPGIGRYTLGAILSQAFDLRLPIVEANSRRVLCRWLGQRKDPRRGPGLRWLWQAAEDLLPARQVGDFNQALMELGALVCTPKQPRCSECPLAKSCTAHRLNLQDQIPAKAAAPRTVAVQEVAVVVRRGTRVLLAQRPGKGRWAGLWEFPHGAPAKREPLRNAAARRLKELTGVEGEIESEIATMRHAVARERITLICFSARYRGGAFRSRFYSQARWLRPDRLQTFPVSAPQRRLVRALTEKGKAAD